MHSFKKSPQCPHSNRNQNRYNHIDLNEPRLRTSSSRDHKNETHGYSVVPGKAKILEKPTQLSCQNDDALMYRYYSALPPLSKSAARGKIGVKGNVAQYVKDCYQGGATQELMFPEHECERIQNDPVQMHNLRETKRLILQFKDKAINNAEDRLAKNCLGRKKGILQGENMMQRTQNNFMVTRERLFNADVISQQRHAHHHEY